VRAAASASTPPGPKPRRRKGGVGGLLAGAAAAAPALAELAGVDDTDPSLEAEAWGDYDYTIDEHAAIEEALTHTDEDELPPLD
jgi:hypothetical protein